LQNPPLQNPKHTHVGAQLSLVFLVFGSFMTMFQEIDQRMCKKDDPHPIIFVKEQTTAFLQKNGLANSC